MGWLDKYSDDIAKAQQGKPIPKKSIQDFLRTNPKYKETNLVEKDNTRVSTNNKPERLSKTARNKTDKEIAQERKAKIQASIEAQNTPYTTDNWRQQLALETQATGDKFRVSNEPNFFDDYVNPAVMVGGMASNLGQAPLQAQQQDSYLPYLTSIGAPLAVGAMAGLGANSTGQFVNNLGNPLAGTGDLIKGAYNKAVNSLENVGIRTSIPDELRQGLHSNGFLDTFKSKPKFKSEINWEEFVKTNNENWDAEDIKNINFNKKEYDVIEQTSKANGSWMKNPDGSVFKGTPEQFIQQNSENFKTAFGNSQLVNSNNSPAFQYHGGKKNNGIFLTPQDKGYVRSDPYTGDEGIYLTPSKNRARSYSRNTPKNERQVYEVYVNMKKPYTKDIKGKFGSDQITSETYSNLNAANYDGVIKHSLFPYNKQTIAFKSNQIKSATGNNGMFDITNPNIYKSLAPIGLGASYLATQGNDEIPQKKNGGIIDDDMGQWNHPGKVTRINSNNITMKGVPYDVIGISDKGDVKRMKANNSKNYIFNGKNVTEIPLAKNGKFINKNWLDNY